MRPRSFRTVLDECLALIRQGESVEACLARHPRQADRLRPLLLLAQRVGQTPGVAPRPLAQATAWNLVRQRAADLRQGRVRPRTGAGWLRPVAVVAALVLAILAAGGGTVYASQDSLPDSPLYPVKLAAEDVRLWFAFDDSSRADLLLNQADERTEEIMAMIQKGKPLPASLLAALRDRNRRATDILEDNPQETNRLARALGQSGAQEELLLALWDDVSASARDEYAEAVATLHNSRLRGSGALGVIQPEDLAGGVLNISGLVEPVTEGLWLVGGVEVRVDERTVGGIGLEGGRTVKVIAARGAQGQLQALSLSNIGAGLPQDGSLVSGAVEEITEDAILVGGQRIEITAGTLLKLKLQKGQQVRIKVSAETGRAVASQVASAEQDSDATAAPTFTYEGTIEGEVGAAGQTNQWTIGGRPFVITPTTVIDAQAGGVKSGARALVEAVGQGGSLVARQVIILAAEADPGSVRLTGVFQGERDGLWLVSGLAVAPPADSEAPETGSLVTIDAQREEERIVGAQALVVEQPRKDRQVHLRGLIAAIDGETWTVGFSRVHVSAETRVLGEAIAGARALVWGSPGGDGTLEATLIRVLDHRPVVPPSQ